MRTAYEAFVQGNVEPFKALCDAERVQAEFRAIGRSPTTGWDSMVALLGELEEQTPTSSFDELTICEAEDGNTVIVLAKMTVKGPDGTVPFDEFHVYRFEGGKIIKFESVPLDQEQSMQLFAPQAK